MNPTETVSTYGSVLKLTAIPALFSIISQEDRMMEGSFPNKLEAEKDGDQYV